MVKKIINDFGSRNPFEIAEALGITVVFQPLGKLYGYCVEVAGQKFITINSELHDFDQRFVCAHAS